jgi:hypothetical protein
MKTINWTQYLNSKDFRKKVKKSIIRNAEELINDIKKEKLYNNINADICLK